MPKLPVEQISRNSELMDKPIWKTGFIGQKKTDSPNKSTSISRFSHFKVAAILAAIVVALLFIYFALAGLNPSLFGRMGQGAISGKFEYPVNVEEIKYPSDFLKDKFLENVQKAQGEGDLEKRYRPLEDNYVLLRGFYSAEPDYAYRMQLDTFAAYMKKHYATKYEANKNLYATLCIDKQCGEVKDPKEIDAIRADIAASSAIGPPVKEAIFRNFDAAGLNAKEQQVNFYLSAYSMLFSVSTQTNDTQLKALASRLLDFIQKDFPEVTIPEDLKP